MILSFLTEQPANSTIGYGYRMGNTSGGGATNYFGDESFGYQSSDNSIRGTHGLEFDLDWRLRP